MTKTWYVATNGSDTNPGTQALPFRTIAKALSVANPGENVALSAGSWGDVVLNKQVALVNATPTKPTLRSLSITADGAKASRLEITGGGDPLVTIAQGKALITVEFCVIHDGSGNGVRNRGSYTTFDSNELYHFASEDAIRLWGDHHTYKNNYIHDVANPGHNDCFQSYRTSGGDAPVTDLLLDNNRIENFTGPDAHCFMVESNGHANWTVTNNRITGIGSHGFILGKPGESGVANIQFHNNAFTNVGGTAIECHGATSGSVTGNTFTNCGGTVGHYDSSNVTGQ